MKMRPTITHPTDRPNFTRLDIGPITLWYSYTTIVAFRDYRKAANTAVIENSWGPTTGKHLNYIDGGDHDTRLDAETFEDRLDEMLERYGLSSSSTIAGR